MKIFEKKNNLQEQEKRMKSRLIAYQKAAEKIERKQPSRHMIRIKEKGTGSESSFINNSSGYINVCDRCFFCFCQEERGHK